MDYRLVYSGMWGYNSLLTGAALGGNLLVLNGYTAAATIMAIIFTSLLQYSVHSIFIKVYCPFFYIADLYLLRNSNIILQMQLPVLALPFVIATSLFMKLSGGSDDLTFPWPTSISSPEKERYRYLARRAALQKVCFSKFFLHAHPLSVFLFGF